MSNKAANFRNLSLKRELRKATDFALARIFAILGPKASTLRRTKPAAILQYLSVLLTEKKHLEMSRRIHYQAEMDVSSLHNVLLSRLLSHDVVKKDGKSASKESLLAKSVLEHIKISTALQTRNQYAINYNRSSLSDENAQRNPSISLNQSVIEETARRIQATNLASQRVNDNNPLGK